MKQDRKFEIILYPDSTDYDYSLVLEKAQRFFQYYAYITHDKDLDDDGMPLKPHTHFIGKRETTITPSGVCYHLGISEVSLANIKNWKAAVRYLVHADNGRKFQYDHSLVTANFEYENFFNEAGEGEEVKKLLQFVYANPKLNMRLLAKYALENNLWASYRRSYTIIKDIINEYKSECWLDEQRATFDDVEAIDPGYEEIKMWRS